MVKRSIISFFVAFALIEAKAQLHSTVVDEQGQPVPYVNVVLSCLPDTAFIAGAITNEEGRFSFDREKDEKVILSVSGIGYVTYSVPSMQCPEKIILQTSNLMLDEVVVKGNKPVFKMSPRGLTVNIQNSIMKDVGTANDVLKRLPGVTGGDGSYSIFGKGSAVIYINGKRVYDNGELERLSSDNIASVEIINNPGVEYDANIKAVIKIKLKKSADTGFGGTFWLRGKQGKRFSDMEQALLTYNANKVNTYVLFSNYATRLLTDQKNKETTYSDAAWELNTDMLGWDNRFYTQTIDGGVSYSPNGNHTLGIKAVYSHNKDHYKGNSDITLWKNKELSETLFSHNVTNNIYDQWMTNVYYNASFSDKLMFSFNGDYVRRTSNDDEWNKEKGSQTQEHIVNGLTDASYDVFAGNAQLKYAIDKANSLTIGGDASKVKERKTYLMNDETILPGSSLNSKEKKIAAFLSYQLNWNKLNIQVGVRYEVLDMLYFQNQELKASIDKTYHKWYPSVNISFPVGKTDMSLGYNTKVVRPSFYQLRNGMEYSSKFAYAKGNPYLLPQYNHDISYSLQYKEWQLLAGYQYVENYIGSQTKVSDANSSVIISQSINYDHYDAWRVGLLYSRSFGVWHPVFGMNLMQTFLSIYDYKGNKINNSSPYIRVSFNNSISLPKEWTLIADGYYVNEGNMREYRMKPCAYMNVSLIKTLFNKSLTMALNVNDVFGTQTEKEIKYSERNTFQKWKYRDCRQVSLMVRYNLNKPKKKYNGKSASEEEINRF